MAKKPEVSEVNSDVQEKLKQNAFTKKNTKQQNENGVGDEYKNDGRVNEEILNEVLNEIRRLKDEINEQKKENDVLKEKIKDVHVEAEQASSRLQFKAGNVQVNPGEKLNSSYVDVAKKMFKDNEVGHKDMVFELRKEHAGTYILPSHAIATFGAEVIPLEYAKNVTSPFKEDHPKVAGWNAETTAIEFIYGSCRVPSTNPNLQMFLLCHPKRGKLFELQDNQLKARQEMAELEKIDEAIARLVAMYHEDEIYLRLFAVHALDIHSSVNCSVDELKLQLRYLVQNEPYVFEDYSEKDCLVRFVYALAEKAGYITVEGDYLISVNPKVPICQTHGYPGDEAFLRHSGINPSYFNKYRDLVLTKDNQIK